MFKKPTKQQWVAIAWVGGLVVAAFLVAVTTAAVVVHANLPQLDEITHYQPRLPLEIFTRDGVELGQFGAERRRFVPIDEIPKILQQAVVASEDATFYTHNGISLKGIARAFVENLRHRGGGMQGGSTITQQVARNFFLSRKQSYSRKFAEVLLALKIERTLTKDRILELYMNQIYLGRHAYGFEAASLTYFGKPSSQLTPAEAAMLAGVPKNPGGADPATHFELAHARQQYVLRRMRDTGVLTDAQYAEAKAQPLKIVGKWTPPVSAEYLAEMVRQTVVQRFGEAAYSQGLKVTTSLIAADQDAARAAVRRGVIDFDRRQPYRGPEDTEDLPDDDTHLAAAAASALHDHADDDDLRVAVVAHASPKEVVAILASGETLHLAGDALRGVQPALRAKATDDIAISRGAIIRVARTTPEAGLKAQWRVAQWPDAESALVSLDTATGQIRALVGGFDFAHSQFNHVTSAWRQPGSSFKPFIYSAALEHALQPASLVNDAPIEIDDALTGGRHWDPKDDDNHFDGPMTLRTALAKSKNLVSIRIVQMLGVNTVRQWASQFDFAPDKHPDNLTLALGAGSVTPLQMVRAYAAFANGGYGVMPRYIEKITDAQGKVLFEAPALPAAPTGDGRIIPARNAFVVASLLNEVTRSGTAAKAQAALKRTDVYGKTGTTNDSVDTWFAGFQPKLATVVWMGRDDNTSMGSREFGATLALPIWIDYMRQAIKSEPLAVLPTPPGVQAVRGDWLYDEFVDGGYIAQLGMEPGNPPSIVYAPKPGQAASEPADGNEAPPPAGPNQPSSSRATLLPPLSSGNAAPAPPRPAPSTTTPDPFQRLPPSLR